MAFGKKAPGTPSPAGPFNYEDLGKPWATREDLIPCNVARGFIGQQLLALLRQEQGIEVEMLLLTVGGIAGQLTQITVFNNLAQASVPLPSRTQTKGKLACWSSTELDSALMAVNPQTGLSGPHCTAAGGIMHYLQILAGDSKAEGTNFELAGSLAEKNLLAGSRGLIEEIGISKAHLPIADIVARLWPVVEKGLANDFDRAFSQYGPVSARQYKNIGVWLMVDAIHFSSKTMRATAACAIAFYAAAFTARLDLKSAYD
jgi:hypothetical protein